MKSPKSSSTKRREREKKIFEAASSRVDDWAKAMIERLKQALRLFGFGQWNKIADIVSARKTADQVKAMAEAFVQCLFSGKQIPIYKQRMV
jgi:hypothetical protein